MMDTQTAWNLRKREQATRGASACVQAAADIREKIFTTFEGVLLVEHSNPVDHGLLRLEPTRLVFAGRNLTRVIPYGSIVLMGSIAGSVASTQHCCYVNSTSYPSSQTFVYDYPLEFHLGAWYHRWLESRPFTEVESSDILGEPPSHR